MNKLKTKEDFEARYLGKRFGIITVTGIAFKEQIWKRKRTLCICKCECGNIKKYSGHSLTDGQIKSCGCLAKTRIGDISRGKPSANRGEYGKSCALQLFHRYRMEARDRGLEFNLSFEPFFTITKQNCFYCNIPPSNKKIARGRLYGDYIYNGIDRVDSSKGYLEDNIVPSCRWCNLAKTNKPQLEFIKWIKIVYKNLQSKNLIGMENV